jgi:hypothetical protein
MSTYTITQDGNKYEVTAEISGAYEPRTRLHPGATPDVDISDIDPEPPEDFDYGEAEADILRAAEQEAKDAEADAKIDDYMARRGRR